MSSSDEKDEVEPSSFVKREPNVVDAQVVNSPTKSHALAEESIRQEEIMASTDSKRLENTNREVKDMGWSDSYAELRPLFGGLSNDALNTLVRRFDKQTFSYAELKVLHRQLLT